MKSRNILPIFVAVIIFLSAKAINAYEWGGVHEMCEHLETTGLSFKYEGETVFSATIDNHANNIAPPM